MGHRPLTGYHVYAFTIPLLILHFPYVMGVDWTLAGELRTIATYFVLAVVWDYLWFVLNPAYTVAASGAATCGGSRSRGSGASRSTTTPGSGSRSASRALAAVADGDASPLWRHLWMLAGLAVLAGARGAAAPLYHRWYRHMRREGADDRRRRGPTRRPRRTPSGRAACRAAAARTAICSVAPWTSSSL